MRRSLARRAIAFTSASVGLRNVSRSVSRTQLLVSRKVGGRMSCSMSGSCLKQKRGGRFPASPWSPLELRRFNRTRRTHFVHRLLGRGFGHRDNRYESAAVGFCTKLNIAFDLGEQCMIGANADIKAGMPGGAALARNDVAGNHVLTAIGLDSEALARRITTVTRCTACFFVSHGPSPT